MTKELKIEIYPDDVWTFVCNNCGWHSNICDAIEDNLCSSCSQEGGLVQIVGSAEEVGNYFMKKLSSKR
ncbi:MAG: hypothetical protein ACXADW_20745 [Candidatus Hodarchaeales archaeon]|jgi:hypothetical protein